MISFKVVGSVSGCHDDVKLEMPITIGLFPILDDQNIQSPATEPSRRGLVHPVSIRPILQQPTAVSPAAINVPSATSAPQIPTAPYPEEGDKAEYHNQDHNINPPSRSFSHVISDPPTYEQATKRIEVDEQFFRPNYPVDRGETSYSSTSNEQIWPD